MSAIEDWNEVPDGEVIIEDCYNEIYEIFSRDGKRWIRQIGWAIGDDPIPKNTERLLDFEPNCTWDQPWYWLKQHRSKTSNAER